mgnify:CR=1 FL=1
MTAVPMYVFTGFLESGKTKFIQETLEDERFNTGERTLLLVFEEGEEEYDLSHPLMKNVHILPIESEEELTTAKLGEWQKMGGKVIITSDSHDINSLTFGFDEAAAAIKAAGFTSVEVLTGHGFETQEL